MPHMTMPRRTPSNSVLSSQRRAITLMMLYAMMMVRFRGWRQILRHGYRGTYGRSAEKKLPLFWILSKSPFPPSPQFGQLVQLFSDVEIQYLNDSLGLKILYVLFIILYMYNLKNILKFKFGIWHFGINGLLKM